MHSDGGCRVGEVRASTTSPMPDHKGFKLQLLVNFQKFSTVRVNIFIFIYRPFHEDLPSLIGTNTV